MNIFNELDYREVLRKTMEERKKIDSSITYQKLAQYMRIQKAYLSQVIKGARNLSQDQLFLALNFLNFSSEEKNYLFLLLELAKCGLKEREKELLKEIKIWQKEKKKTAQYIDVKELSDHNFNRQDYFLDPFNQIIHTALYIEEFRNDPLSLAKKLFIPKKRISTYLKNLERMNIIKVTSQGIELMDVELHLPKDSPIFDSYKSQCYTNTMNRLKQIEESKTYNFTVVFSATDEIRQEINENFMKFLVKTKKLVADCKPDEVMQMNFDLFSWSKTK